MGTKNKANSAIVYRNTTDILPTAPKNEKLESAFDAYVEQGMKFMKGSGKGNENIRELNNFGSNLVKKMVVDASNLQTALHLHKWNHRKQGQD